MLRDETCTSNWWRHEQHLGKTVPMLPEKFKHVGWQAQHLICGVSKYNTSNVGQVNTTPQLTATETYIFPSTHVHSRPEVFTLMHYTNLRFTYRTSLLAFT